MKICVVTEGYPSPGRPGYHFVEQICNEWARQGNSIFVIAPHSLTKRLFRHLAKVQFERHFIFGEGEVTVYSPEFISLGNFGRNGINRYFFKKAISRTAKKINKPEVVYGHFWHNARSAFGIARKWNIPLIVATGEAEIEQQVITKSDKEFVKYVNAVICVSSKNKKESIEKGLTDLSKCIILPNAIDDTLFTPLDKETCRNKLGFRRNDFIVAFVGGLIYRKGPERVAAAIKQLNNPNIKSFFIGSNRDGELVLPDCEGILYCGTMPHEQIPVYLNAADIFVLPTLHEGCCNSIVEAISCGLPVISSDLPFNYDILDEENSILIDPLKPEEIANAITRLYKDKDLRDKMSESSLKKSKKLTIPQRAKSILDFIKEKCHIE